MAARTRALHPVISPHPLDTTATSEHNRAVRRSNLSVRPPLVITPNQTLDLAGLKCPLPALKTAKALKGLPPGTHLRVISTDPLSVIDIPNLLNSTGDTLLAQVTEDARIVFDIRKAGGAG